MYLDIDNMLFGITKRFFLILLPGNLFPVWLVEGCPSVTILSQPIHHRFPRSDNPFFYCDYCVIILVIISLLHIITLYHLYLHSSRDRHVVRSLVKRVCGSGSKIKLCADTDLVPACWDVRPHYHGNNSIIKYRTLTWRMACRLSCTTNMLCIHTNGCTYLFKLISIYYIRNSETWVCPTGDRWI